MKRSLRRASWISLFSLACTASFLSACSTHHWAEVQASQLPPPPGEKVIHTDRLVVEVTDVSEETQCVVYKSYHPVCFYNVRSSIESGLKRSLWPAFPEVSIGSKKDAGPQDYFLQVEVTLDALPPDDEGPGWSAGARSRYRLFRGDELLSEQTLASRSRAHFPYGAPLGEGATEVVDATIIHMATMVSQVPESKPDAAMPLPQVAARDIKPRKNENSAPAHSSSESAVAKNPASDSTPNKASESQAKVSAESKGAKSDAALKPRL